MLLAAGFGTRMRPLTAATAKPLLTLGGRALIDHALDRLGAAGVETVVVNAHWQADRVAAHLATRRNGPHTILRREPELLDTGGAVRAALACFEDAPLFVVNGDSFWLDGPVPTLERLAAAWDPAAANAVLLVHRTFHVFGDVGSGDFAVDPWGVLRRRGQREIVPYVFAGVQLADPGMFAEAPEGRFSMNDVWDPALARGRLHGIVHDGLWFHLSTPEDLADAESVLQSHMVGWSR
ncbi:MAG TPA: nucleotidyltransferase family protein [Acetobacteraceae bacterium]|jgi:MurNAc alpha-1-phosphate uridylyltransferase|nr:nucleotidyltransferase family protein [Acetobacteraceae bacterium]